jgi:hypothetical protein
MAEPWFDPSAFATWYGAIVGGVGGTILGILWCVAGVLIPKGEAKRLVLGGMTFFCFFGLASFATGMIALALGQPRGIWFTLGVVGMAFSLATGPLIPQVQWRYRLAEQRRLEAESIRRG